MVVKNTAVLICGRQKRVWNERAYLEISIEGGSKKNEVSRALVPNQIDTEGLPRGTQNINTCELSVLK